MRCRRFLRSSLCASAMIAIAGTGTLPGDPQIVLLILPQFLAGNSATSHLRGVEGTDSSFGRIVIGQGILIPFAVVDVAVEPDVGMDRHAVVGKHALVDAFADVRGDWLGCRWIDEERTGLEDKNNAGTEVSAATKAVGR